MFSEFTPETLQSLLTLAIGFALAGVLASGYQCITEEPAGFELMARSRRLAGLAAVPFLTFAAPFIIMRNTLRGVRIEGRRVEYVMLATIVSGFWSLMSGSVVVMALRAIV